MFCLFTPKSIQLMHAWIIYAFVYLKVKVMAAIAVRRKGLNNRATNSF